MLQKQFCFKNFKNEMLKPKIISNQISNSYGKTINQ